MTKQQKPAITLFLQTPEKRFFFVHPVSGLAWEPTDIEWISEEQLDPLFDEYRILTSLRIDDRIGFIFGYIIPDLLSALLG